MTQLNCDVFIIRIFFIYSLLNYGIFFFSLFLMRIPEVINKYSSVRSFYAENKIAATFMRYFYITQQLKAKREKGNRVHLQSINCKNTSANIVETVHGNLAIAMKQCRIVNPAASIKRGSGYLGVLPIYSPFIADDSNSVTTEYTGASFKAILQSLAELARERNSPRRVFIVDRLRF